MISMSTETLEVSLMKRREGADPKRMKVQRMLLDTATISLVRQACEDEGVDLESAAGDRIANEIQRNFVEERGGDLSAALEYCPQEVELLLREKPKDRDWTESEKEERLKAIAELVKALDPEFRELGTKVT